MNILVPVVPHGGRRDRRFCGGVVLPAQLCAQAQPQNPGHDQARHLEHLESTWSRSPARRSKQDQMTTRGLRSRRISAVALFFLTAAALGVSVSAPTYAGHYDSDATSIKSGPILDRDYWRAKWDSMRLEDAIKERQPEGAVL